MNDCKHLYFKMKFFKNIFRAWAFFFFKLAHNGLQLYAVVCWLCAVGKLRIAANRYLLIINYLNIKI